MMVKIIVEEIPKNSKECPFAFFSPEGKLPDVCSLKLEAYEIQSGVTFSTNQCTNCDVEKCQFLKGQAN